MSTRPFPPLASSAQQRCSTRRLAPQLRREQSVLVCLACTSRLHNAPPCAGGRLVEVQLRSLVPAPLFSSAVVRPQAWQAFARNTRVASPPTPCVIAAPSMVRNSTCRTPPVSVSSRTDAEKKTIFSFASVKLTGKSQSFSRIVRIIPRHHSGRCESRCRRGMNGFIKLLALERFSSPPVGSLYSRDPE